MRVTRIATLALLALAMAGCKNNPTGKSFDVTRLEIYDNTSHDVTDGEVPQSINKEFRTMFPSAQVTRIELRQYSAGHPYYRFHFATEPGAERMWDYNVPATK